MKKNFKLAVEGKKYDRTVEAVKNEIRKYIKRQYRKPLPESADYLEFDCKFSLKEEDAKVIHFKDITDKINEAVAENADGFYIEILGKHGKRKNDK